MVLNTCYSPKKCVFVGGGARTRPPAPLPFPRGVGYSSPVPYACTYRSVDATVMPTYWPGPCMR